MTALLALVAATLGAAAFVGGTAASADQNCAAVTNECTTVSANFVAYPNPFTFTTYLQFMTPNASYTINYYLRLNPGPPPTDQLSETHTLNSDPAGTITYTTRRSRRRARVSSPTW